MLLLVSCSLTADRKSILRLLFINAVGAKRITSSQQENPPVIAAIREEQKKREKLPFGLELKTKQNREVYCVFSERAAYHECHKDFC